MSWTVLLLYFLSFLVAILEKTVLVFRENFFTWFKTFLTLFSRFFPLMRSFVPAWTIKPSGLYFKKSSSLSKVASLLLPGILFTLMPWFLGKTFSLIPFSNESSTIIILLFLNCSFVQLHEFLIVLQSSLLSSESLDWTKETLPLIH